MTHIKFNRKALTIWVLFLISALVVANPGKMTSASGMVRDAETGEGLPFVTIMFENSKTGVISDIDGLFQITGRESMKVLTGGVASTFDRTISNPNSRLVVRNTE